MIATTGDDCIFVHSTCASTTLAGNTLYDWTGEAIDDDSSSTISRGNNANGVIGANLTGTVVASYVATSAIQTSHIQPDAITATCIGTSAVTAAKIADNTVTTDKIAGSGVYTSNINSEAVNAFKIGVGAVRATHIETSSIKTSHILPNSVTTTCIGTDAVTGAEIEESAVTTAHLETKCVTNPKIGTSAVMASQIAASAVGATQINTGIITGSKLTASAFNGLSGGLDTSSVVTSYIAPSAVTTTVINASSVTTDKLSKAYGYVEDTVVVLTGGTAGKDCDFVTIDAGLASGSRNVYIKAGTYTESPVVDQNGTTVILEQGVTVNGTWNVSGTDCAIKGSGWLSKCDGGTTDDHVFDVSGARCTITGLRIDNTQGTGNSKSLIYINAANCLITGNVFEDCDYYSIWVYEDDDGTIISNNTFLNSDSGHIYVDGSSANKTKGVISGNYFTGTTPYAVLIGHTTYGWAITGNYVNGSGSTAGMGVHGMFCAVTGNCIYNVAKGIEVGNGSHSQEHVIISGNSIDTCSGHGIHVQDTSHFINITGNCVHNITGTGKWSIYLEGDYPIVMGNVLDGSTTSGGGIDCSSACTGTIAIGNILRNHTGAEMSLHNDTYGTCYANTDGAGTMYDQNLFGMVTAATTTFQCDRYHFMIDADASGGAFTVTLYPSSYVKGQIMIVKKTDSGGNAVTVDGWSAETIDGAANVSLAAQYDTWMGICDGSNWHTIVTGSP